MEIKIEVCMICFFFKDKKLHKLCLNASEKGEQDVVIETENKIIVEAVLPNLTQVTGRKMELSPSRRCYCLTCVR